MNRYDKIASILQNSNGGDKLSKEDMQIVRGANKNKLTVQGWERFNDLYNEYGYNERFN